MTHRKRRIWARTAIGSVALAVLAVLAVQGCAPATPAAADAGVQHDLSIAAAKAAYGEYLTDSAAEPFRVHGWPALARSNTSSVVTAGPRWPFVSARRWADARNHCG